MGSLELTDVSWLFTQGKTRFPVLREDVSTKHRQHINARTELLSSMCGQEERPAEPGGTRACSQASVWTEGGPCRPAVACNSAAPPGIKRVGAASPAGHLVPLSRKRAEVEQPHWHAGQTESKPVGGKLSLAATSPREGRAGVGLFHLHINGFQNPKSGTAGADTGTFPWLAARSASETRSLPGRAVQEERPAHKASAGS